MLAAAKEETFAPLGSGEEIFSLAAAGGLLGTHVEGKTETLSKTRVWGFGEKMLPDIRATWQLSGNTRWGCEKSSWKTVLGSALDNSGNTVTDPAGKSYTWDFENRLTQLVVPSTGTVSLRYDPFGRRIQKSSPLGTTNYLYDGNNLLEELDLSASVLARYTHGSGVDQPLAELRSGTTSYYEQDGLGSVSSLSNAAGALANTYSYDSFGKLTASTGTITNQVQYTGREFDSDTGVYFYRARYYDPQIGRFISEDPISFGGGIDFYAYVLNSPTNLTDPWGLKGCVETPKGLVCWDDGKPGGTIFRPKPPSNPVPDDISNDFNAFWNCANHVTTKCSLPKPPGGNPFSPPGGPKGDMGVTPNEGTVPLPQFNLPNACDCLRQHPLAALDPRFNFGFGNQTAGISPGCMVSIP